MEEMFAPEHLSLLISNIPHTDRAQNSLFLFFLSFFPLSMFLLPLSSLPICIPILTPPPIHFPILFSLPGLSQLTHFLLHTQKVSQLYYFVEIPSDAIDGGE